MKHKVTFLFSILISTVIIFSFGFTGGDKVNNKPDSVYNIQNDEWVENTIKNMTLEEKAGQLVFPIAYASAASMHGDEYNKLLHYINDLKVGGFIFYNGKVYDQAEVLNELQKISKVPLLVSADFENGAAENPDYATIFPTNMALGAADDSMLTYKMGYIIAKEGLAFGVHQNYAPVTDVNNNPYNPIINVRSYGENVDLVTKLSTAFVKGTQDAGMIATCKHFPGHGNTDVDSHRDVPVINGTKEQLMNVELKPFISNINNGVMSCMIAHLLVPAFDNKLPASLSHSIICELLRNELKFNGLIVSDAMNMRAITNTYSQKEAAIIAINAGMDVLEFPDDPDACVAGIIEGVKSGEISEARLDYSVRKILLAKKWVGLDKNRLVDINKIKDYVHTSKNLLTAKTIAEKSITLVKNDDKIIPLKHFTPNVIHVVISGNKRNDNGQYFDSLLSSKCSLRTVMLNSSSKWDNYQEVLDKSVDYNIIVLSEYMKVRAFSGTIAIDDNAKNFIEKLTSTGKKIIFISHGNPYLLSLFPKTSTYLCNYGDTKVSEEAMVKALFGEINISGKLPISIPNTPYTFGSGIKLNKVSENIIAPKEKVNQEAGLKSENKSDVQNKDKFTGLKKVISDAINDQAFPGAVVLAAKDGKIVFEKAFGNYTYEKNAPKMQTNTLFDLASVSKVIATTSAAMICVDRGLFKLDDKVSKYIPEFASKEKGEVKIINLLLHNSGLLPDINFYKPLKSKEETLQEIYNSELTYPTGTKTEYSDLGMITMGKIIEKVTGKSLDKFCHDEIFKPLGMKNTFYNPSQNRKKDCAPTEIDNYWRNKLVQGEVHDETAAVLGGVAGHAGLFSNAEDLSKILQMILNKGEYNGKRYIKAETVKLFTKRYSAESTRGIGWDTKSETGSSAGHLFSINSYGHTGFTGTSVWTDPDKKLIVVFLTNRVYPTRNNNKIMKVRPLVHDEVYKALDK